MTDFSHRFVLPTGPLDRAGDHIHIEDSLSTDSPSRQAKSVAGARRSNSGNRRLSAERMTEVRRVASFASAGWRSPRTVGTILPSGPALARRLAAVVPSIGHTSSAPVVVEVGAGTGELTPTIVARAGKEARVIAVERDPELAGILRDRDLGVEVVAADAGTLPELLAERELPGVDAVISALPWALLTLPQQRKMLGAFHASLHPTGVFTTLAYSCGLWMPSAVNFRRAMSALFDEVLPTRTVWFNAPPAMTYVCRRPRPRGQAT